MNYQIAYRIGFHPWEDAETEVGFSEKIAELFAGEESGRKAPYGKALDLDHQCRTKHCVKLDHLEPVSRSENARRRWRVRGVAHQRK